MKMSSKRQEQAKFIDKLSKDNVIHFGKPEVEELLSMYNKHVEGTNNKKLDRLKFRDILHHSFKMTDDVLMDRVFRAFDKDTDNYISQKEWIEGLSVFLRGQFQEKIEFCFSAYDLNSDGYISREELFQLLKPCLVKQPTEEDPDEGIKDLVELCLKKMDDDHDGRLSVNDFTKAVYTEPLLLEAFGPCLPNHEVCATYLSLLGDEHSIKF